MTSVTYITISQQELEAVAFKAASLALLKAARQTGEQMTLREVAAGDTWAQGNSYLGLIGQTTHPHTQRAHIANALRRRGHAVAGDLSKIYHRPQPCKNSTP